MSGSSSAFLARLHDLEAREAIAVREGASGSADHGTSFATLLGESRDLARALLRRLGDRPSLAGERVALLISPGIAWVRTLFAIVYAGGIAVPLSPLHPVTELAYFVEDADVVAVFLSPDLEDRRPAFEGRLVLGTGELSTSPTPTAPLPSRGVRDGALMLYTSGTTGRPKGALLTDENLATQARLVATAWKVSPDDRLLHALPLHHMHGVAIAFFTVFCAGAETRFLPRFDAHGVWDALADATIFMGVPTMYHRLFEAFDAAPRGITRAWMENAKALRLATSGSAALPVTLAERWAELTGRIPLERFGMTEIGVGASNPLGADRHAGTVGHPLETVVLRIVDETFADVPDGEPGEILIAGPSVFAGYFRRPEATAAAFHDGFFRTGDTARRDPALGGAIRILGRTSVDILKSGGYKLSALEIEETIRQHASVVDVAVIGIPDERWGDRVVAVVHHREGLDEDTLRAFCKEHLAPYKVPREFVFGRELPRNALGKVQKTALRDLLVNEARAATATER